MKQKGVTIIELVVVLAIFAFIIATTVNIFISAIQQQRNALREQELLNQASYDIEYMSRMIRMVVNDTSGACLGGVYAGYDYLLTHYDNASGFYQGVRFISDDNNCYNFFLDTDGILKSQFQGNTYNILSRSQLNNFTIKYVRFVVNGNKILDGDPPSNLLQPRITILINIQTQTGQSKVFQTTVSQRNLNAT